MNTKHLAARDTLPALRTLEALNGGPLTIGQALQSLRKCDQLTLTQFAGRLGISPVHLCDIETCRRTVSARRAARWAQLLGHPPSVFVELALQSELDAAGLRLKVYVKAA